MEDQGEKAGSEPGSQGSGLRRRTVVAGLAASAAVMTLPASASKAHAGPATGAGNEVQLPAAGAVAEPIPPSAASTLGGDDHTLLALSLELLRLRRRITVLERRMREKEAMLDTLSAERNIPLLLAGGFPNPEAEALRHEVGRDAAWQAWSSTIGRAEQLADRMRRLPARSVEGLSAKFDALLWALYHDRLDLFEARRLVGFGRELRAFARGADAPRL
jgi:hypothetical protein